MATKAQLAKAAAELKKTQAALAKAAQAAKKPAPTSGAIPNFKPAVKMPTPTKRPGDPGFVGPVVPAEKAFIYNQTGTLEEVYTSGPKAGTSVATGGLVIQGSPGSLTAAEAANVTSGTGGNTGGGNTAYKPTREDIDAFEELGLILKSYGLESLADTYGRLMAMGKTAGQALTILKYDKTIDPVTGQPYNAAYAKRFAGNAARVAAGMNAYDEGTYLQVENAYEETLRRYGLSNMISPDRAVNQAKFADYMGKGIAPTEFAGRIQTVADEVINADPDIKSTFKTFFPSITDADLVAYFLDPKQTLPVLQTKVRAAEIGGAAKTQNLSITQERAMELGKFGVTRKDAITGFSQVAEALPTGKKLSDIYAEEKIGYTQQVAEDEYLKQDAQAKLKRNRLASKERAMFSGQSGVDSSSLTRQTMY
jgi:hypothetical protein